RVGASSRESGCARLRVFWFRRDADLAATPLQQASPECGNQIVLESCSLLCEQLYCSRSAESLPVFFCDAILDLCNVSVKASALIETSRFRSLEKTRLLRKTSSSRCRCRREAVGQPAARSWFRSEQPKPWTGIAARRRKRR